MGQSERSSGNVKRSNEQPARDTERYAKVNVVAPDGSIEDSVKVTFGHEQPLGIDPLKHDAKRRWADEYKLELVHIVVDGEVFKS